VASFYSVLTLLLHIKKWPGQRTEVLNLFAQPMPLLFLSYAMLHGFSLWGAVFFNKLHFIKTAFIFFITIVLLSIINTSFVEALIGREIRTATPFATISFYEKHRYVWVDVVRQTDPLVIGVFIVVAIIFWAAAYYRLKEKQV
jgi:hypothetical protein